MGEHARHRKGDVNTCPDCGKVAYEPSWYATMLAFSKEERAVIVISAEEAIASEAG
jgi:hypothetical protein